MTKITEAQFRVLCHASQGKNVYLEPYALLNRVMSLNLVQQVKIDGFHEWELTEEGREIIEDRGKELAKPHFGNLKLFEKEVILDEEVYPLEQRRRLMFDKNERIAKKAIRKIPPTEEEYEQLANSSSESIRAASIMCDIQRYRGDGLRANLAPYLAYTDYHTIQAILRVLTDTGNLNFVDDKLIDKWFQGDIPNEQLLALLANTHVNVTNSRINALLQTQDSAVLSSISYYYLDRLDSQQIDNLIQHGGLQVRLNIAMKAQGLTPAQIRRLARDNKSIVAMTMQQRVNKLAKALQLVTDDPNFITEIRHQDTNHK